MKPRITLRRALTDKNLLGNALSGESWFAWRTLLIASMGEALTDAERAIFTKLTSREREPLQRVEEAALVIGRRGGKSKAMSALGSYLAAFGEPKLVRGERGVVLLIAPDQRQAKIVLDYCEGTLSESRILKQLIANRNADTLELTNRVSIEVRAASFRRLRGMTLIAAICDEAAFWHSDEFRANPDVEIVNAVRPSLLTTGGPLIIASSPYAKRGVLWSTFKNHYGPEGDPLILVARGATRDLNPSLPQSVIDREYEKDPARAAGEYGANFRTDIESFIARELVETCVDVGVHERPPMSGTTYFSFTDPSGGVRDPMTCAIAHMDDDFVVVDAVREIPAPLDPDTAVDEFAALFKRYGINSTYGDRFGAEWTYGAFRKRGITYLQSELARSGLYLNLLPHITTKKLRLVDNARAVSQIANLERRTHRGTKDTIDHPDGAHDDLANAIAGAVYVASVRSRSTAAQGYYCWGMPEEYYKARHEEEKKRKANKLPLNVANPQSPPCTIDFRKLEAERALQEGLSRRLINPRVF